MDGCRRDLCKAKKKITRCIGILQRDLPGIQVSDLPTKVRELCHVYILYLSLIICMSFFHVNTLQQYSTYILLYYPTGECRGPKAVIAANNFHVILCSNQHIFIGNAGLTTNADESSLVELITSVGSGLEALTLLPGKQYSFASFTSPEQAQSIYLVAHGHLGVRGSASPVYMAYVDRGWYMKYFQKGAVLNCTVV